MKSTKCGWALLSVFLLALSLATACGDDDDDTSGSAGAGGDGVAEDGGDGVAEDGGDVSAEDGGGSDISDEDAGNADLSAFGEPCEQSSDCVDGVCQEFGQLGKVCTETCTDDSTCPDGSEGQKCNNKGFCRP